MRRATTVPDLLAHQSHWNADSLAVVDGDARLTYRDLQSAVDDTARALVARGVAPGDRVAILAPNSHHWISTALAIKSIGAWLLPLNTRLMGPELEQILKKAGARLVFTVRGFLRRDYEADLRACDLAGLDAVIAMTDADGTRSPELTEFLSTAATVPIEEVRRRTAALGPDDIGYMLYTSGTTGDPKGVMLSHGGVIEMITTFSDRLECVAGERILAVSPFSHLYGLFSGILMTLVNGGTIYPLPILKPDEALALIEAEGITHVFGPPTVYQMLISATTRSERDLSTLRLAQCGAANIPPDLIRSIVDDLGFSRVSTAYGLTEAVGTVSATASHQPVEEVALSTGTLLPGVTVRIVDDDLCEVPAGTSGEILVHAPGRLMAGYFGDDAPPSPVDADGFLHTGDSGHWNESGHLVVTGRKKDMFTVGGFNVYPAEVEKALYADIRVAHAAVVSEPDAKLGEVPVAYVVARDGAEVDAADLIAWCAGRLANYKVPRHIEFVGELPMTASGKIQKSDLRRQGGQQDHRTHLQSTRS